MQRAKKRGTVFLLWRFEDNARGFSCERWECVQQLLWDSSRKRILILVFGGQKQNTNKTKKGGEGGMNGADSAQLHN